MRVIKANGPGLLAASCVGFLLLSSSPVLGDDLEQGIAAFEQGRYTVALPLLQKAADRDGASSPARAYLALTKAAMGDCKGALPVLSGEAKQTKTEVGRLSGMAAARCYSSAGDDVAAIAILDDLSKQHPNDPDVLYLIAKTNMKAFNDATFSMFQRTPSSYRVHQLSAEILEIQNRYPDAVAEYRKAIELNGKAPDLHYRLGRALLLQGHSPEALQEASAAFEAELKLSPEDAPSEFQLGQIAQVGGKTQEAQAHFERALVLSPDFVTAAIALGKLYTQEKNYSGAIDLLKHAVQLQPENEAAHYALLTAYRNAGQMDNAKAEKATLDRLQKPPEGEFTDFLKRLGDKPAPQ
jgi:tetratricopeptide (TPR) repeat protein